MADKREDTGPAVPELRMVLQSATRREERVGRVMRGLERRSSLLSLFELLFSCQLWVLVQHAASTDSLPSVAASDTDDLLRGSKEEADE